MEGDGGWRTLAEQILEGQQIKSGDISISVLSLLKQFEAAGSRRENIGSKWLWRSRPPKACHQKAPRYGGLANFYTRARKELSGVASCSLFFRKNQPKSSLAKNCAEKGNDK